MDKVPSISGTRGIFEYFIPGTFLLLNIIAGVSAMPFVDQTIKVSLSSLLTNSVIGLVIVICFGYILGVLLRLLRVDLPDMLSAAWLRRFSRSARKGKGQYAFFATEPFPYFGWMEESCQHYLLPEALQFYKRVWAKRNHNDHNKEFINFCKILISTKNELAANEIYAAEALSRYIAGMFYAMSISFLLFLGILIAGIFQGSFQTWVILILAAYFLGILVIIQNFRRIRIREIDTVFAACFSNRMLFEEENPNQNDAAQST